MTRFEDSRSRSKSALKTIIALLVLCGCSTSTPHRYDPAQQIEYRYSGVGPFPVTSFYVPPFLDSPGGLVYLRDSHRDPAPLIIWQDGTGESIGTYDAIARHLASWGMVVMGSDDRQMGSDAKAIGLLEKAQLWSIEPDHPLFQRIAPNTSRSSDPHRALSVRSTRIRDLRVD